MPRVLTEEHKAALAAGRTRAAEERAAKRKEQFDAFARWSERDARLYRAWQRGDLTYEEYRERKIPMPPIPVSSEEAAA
jgi:hypothetical protein